jgi:hypothetical protein
VTFGTDPVIDELRAEAAQWLVKDTRISEFSVTTLPVTWLVLTFRRGLGKRD